MKIISTPKLVLYAVGRVAIALGGLYLIGVGLFSDDIVFLWRGTFVFVVTLMLSHECRRWRRNPLHIVIDKTEVPR